MLEKKSEEMSPYERLGSQEGLRRIVQAFLSKVYQDPIIGFFFEGIDQAQLLEREVEFAAGHLGGPEVYQGRPIGRVHRPHRINKGHFHRRQWLVETTLREHGVAEDIIQIWREQEKALEKAITDGTTCQG